MSSELALLNNYLIVGAMLFGIGMIGFLSRRNMIVMFLSLEIMLQGVSLSLVAWGRFHNDFGGQTLTLLIVAVAACEAALALALVLTLFARRDRLDITDWQLLRESNQPPYYDEPQPAAPPVRRDQPLPRLPVAGVRPETSPDETDYRPEI
ncbi:MAG: NADH-quinone oxidoreductase subunit NuoK [Thermoguttaceae bacterium]